MGTVHYFRSRANTFDLPPDERDTAAIMANALFQFAVWSGCQGQRVALYRELGISSTDARRLDAEAVRLMRVQIASMEARG